VLDDELGADQQRRVARVAGNARRAVHVDCDGTSPLDPLRRDLGDVERGQIVRLARLDPADIAPPNLSDDDAHAPAETIELELERDGRLEGRLALAVVVRHSDILLELWD